jgi:hypothetical protein
MMLALALSLALGNVVTLDATTETLEVTTSSTASTDYSVSYVDNASGTITPGSSHGNIASATTTAILAAPGASTQRAVAAVTLCNVSTTASNAVTLKHDTSATERVIGKASLAPGECVAWDNSGVPRPLTSGGVQKLGIQPVTIGGRPYRWTKSATATDAAGYSYGFFKDTGMPGAQSLGTPGLNGVVTDCSVVGTAGSGGALTIGAPLFTNAASGSLYLKSASVTAAAAGTYALIDVLWINSGLVVTTTTAQTTTTPTLPARDSNGSTNGEDIELALLTTTANTNAAVIANTAASYTDSDGNAGNSAVFFGLVGFQAPATPVIGTWMPFQYAAGDRGIRALASITLGTSYGGGALSAVLYRTILVAGVNVANTPTLFVPEISPRLYNGSCLQWVAIGNPATTAPAMSAAVIQVVER